MKAKLHRCHRGNKSASRPRNLSLFAYAGWCCEKCGSKEKLTRDHIIPKSFGGVNNAVNIQILCKSCNEEKGATVAVYTPRKRVIKYVQSMYPDALVA